MVMTSRERVLTTFAHEEPDRVPLWFGASREMWEGMQKKFSLDDEGLKLKLGDDFRPVHARDSGPALKDSANRLGIKREGIGCGQALNHPLAKATLKEIHDFPWPDPKWYDASGIKAQVEARKGKYAIMGGLWSPFWHEANDLLGMENLFMKMYDEPEAVDAVFEHLSSYYFEANKRIFDTAGKYIDIFFMGNDLGSQNGPLVSPELFRRFLLPHFRKLIELGHAYNLKVQLHCCGGIEPLIPGLISVGLDALHAVQTTCAGMDLVQLKKNYGKRMVFNGGIDSHHILMESTPEVVRERTKEILKIMMPGGGYVAGASHDTVLPETPVENVLAMCDTVREFGKYNNNK